jgi:hypothetical protein
MATDPTQTTPDLWLWGHDAGMIEGARIPPDDLTPEQQAEWLRGYADGAGWNGDTVNG